ncbi:hypothetical protein L6R49_22750 [Myxococcota bacterium]|nr:hypothetical protein [Myxococcota bacterium]
MRTTGCSWAREGVLFGLVGLLVPGSAWASCTEVELGESLFEALGLGSEGDGTISLLGDTELCFDEGWSDADAPDCLYVLPGKNLTITVQETDGVSGLTPVSLPGLHLPAIVSTRTIVSVKDANIVGICTSIFSGGAKARVFVEGDHTINFTDVTLEGGSLYGLYADDGTIDVRFTDPLTVFAESFVSYPAVKLAGAAADYMQTGGVLKETTDSPALKSYGATVTLEDVTFSGNGGDVSGGALFLQNGTVNITGGSFTDNHAASGGAIWGDSSLSLTLNGVSFSDNTAQEYGGAVAVNTIQSLTLADGTSFDGDNARFGGAVAINASQTLIVEEARFSGTWATDSGGAILASGGNWSIGTASAAPSFTSTSAPSGAAITFIGGNVSTKVTNATFSDVSGGYAIDVSASVSNRVDLSGLTSPDGLGTGGLLRVHSGGYAMLSSSTITGVDAKGAPTQLEADAGLIEVKAGALDVHNNVLCGFIADPLQPLINIDEPKLSVSFAGNTLMNLDGLSAGQGFMRVSTTQSVYVYNNSFIGAADGAQAGILGDRLGSFMAFNNLFHQLATGMLLVGYADLDALDISYNLYSDTVGAAVELSGDVYTPDASSKVYKDPRFVRAFDPTSCGVWPYLLSDSPAANAGTTKSDGARDVGESAYIGAWGVLDPGDDAAVDTDGDGHTIIDDCDDNDAAVSPSAPERAGNSVDDDCDGEVDERPDTGQDDTGTDDTATDDTGVGDDTGIVVEPDRDGDGVPDDEDCAPEDEGLSEDCPSRVVYTGGRLGCATAPPAGLSALGLLIVGLAGARRRRPSIVG